MDINIFDQYRITEIYNHLSSLDESELKEIINRELSAYSKQSESAATGNFKSPSYKIEKETNNLFDLLLQYNERINDIHTDSEDLRKYCVSIFKSCDIIYYYHEYYDSLDKCVFHTMSYDPHRLHFLPYDDFELACYYSLCFRPESVFDLINKYPYPAEFISNIICSVAPILVSIWGITPACLTAVLSLSLKEYIKLLYKERKLLKYGPSRQISRPNYNFFQMGMQMGNELIWKKDHSIRVQILTEKTVLYDGKEIALGRLTATLNRSSSKYLSPGRYWLYEDRLFKDIYDETYPPIF